MEALLSVCLLDIWIMVVGVLEVMNEIAEMEVFSFLSLAVGDVCDCLFSHLDAWCFAGLFSSCCLRWEFENRGDQEVMEVGCGGLVLPRTPRFFE